MKAKRLRWAIYFSLAIMLIKNSNHSTRLFRQKPWAVGDGVGGLSHHNKTQISQTKSFLFINSFTIYFRTKFWMAFNQMLAFRIFKTNKRQIEFRFAIFFYDISSNKFWLCFTWFVLTKRKLYYRVRVSSFRKRIFELKTDLYHLVNECYTTNNYIVQ